MEKKEISAELKKWGGFYLAGILCAVGLRYYYGHAGSDELKWILGPVAGWAKCLCGLDFVYQTGVGYINHPLRFIIAPSCSGIRFLMIAMLMMLFTFVHRMKTWKRGAVWTGLCLVSAYAYTVFVNGIRIVLSICIPIWMEQGRFHIEWLTSERLHTMIGTTVYFTALLLLYQAVDRLLYICGKAGREEPYGDLGGRLWYVVPMFWYISLVLLLPFLHRAVGADQTGFLEYSVMVTGMCLAVLAAARFGRHLLAVCRR